MSGMNLTATANYFDLSDYSVFAAMLLLSVLIGIYFGCFGNKQNTADEYLFGGKRMKPLPVALSLVASSVSGLTLIGVPTEVYTEDATYWILAPTLIIICVIALKVHLPIYLELQLSSIYEYLELRFDKWTRTFASVMYCFATLICLPSIIYIPSLSLSQVTGIPLHLITVGTTTICVFYTTIGGLKAVVWTDFIQTMITILGCCAIVIIGTINAGGLTHILNTSYADGKLDIFNFDPNPFQRTSFWIMFIGTLGTWGSFLTVQQHNIQRFMALESIDSAKFVISVYWICLSSLVSMSVYVGILVYVTYYGCDPIEQKIVSNADQIFPFYVMDKVGYVPCLPGLFVAGVFSAALSSLSTGLNTISGTLYEDFIRRRFNVDKKAHLVMKVTVVLIGIFAVSMVFVVEKMGKALSVSYILTGVVMAPVSVLFFLGIFVPMANEKGAKIGALTSLIVLAWLAMGSTFKKVNFTKKPVYPDYADVCVSNQTLSQGPNEPEDVFFLYKLSYIMYIPFGLLIGVTTGIAVSYITGPKDLKDLNPKLIAAPLRRFLPENANKEQDKLMLATK